MAIHIYEHTLLKESEIILYEPETFLQFCRVMI